MINFKDKFTHAQPLIHETPKHLSNKFISRNLFMFKCKEKIAAPIFLNLFTPKPENKCNIRLRRKLTEPFYSKKRTQFNIDYRDSHL